MKVKQQRRVESRNSATAFRQKAMALEDGDYFRSKVNSSDEKKDCHN
jgi:hypothetical protein